MHHATPPEIAKARPLVEFIRELEILQGCIDDARVDHLKDILEPAIGALKDLQLAADELPDLTGSQWFLLTSYTSSRARILDKLETARLHMEPLIHDGDPAKGLLATGTFIREFLTFSTAAYRDLSLLQRPFTRTSHLILPKDMRNGLNHESHGARPPQEPDDDILACF